MIPKIIHYCWFGPAKMNNLALKCIESWKTYLPDYELMLWNEESFDLSSTIWTKQAYEAKKYAFITDYVRLYALKKYGGIYMDTDVEVVKRLDRFLDCPAFSGFETPTMIPTGIMASEIDGVWVNLMLKYYDNKSFIGPDGNPDLLSNVTIITNMMSEYGFIPNNEFQTCNGIFHLYPRDYFCPKDQATLQVLNTSNTHCIHHFNGSWLDDKAKFKRQIKQILPLWVYNLYRRIQK